MEIKRKLEKLSERYRNSLSTKTATRLDEMAEDDASHFLVYNVLGVDNDEGELIDLYQNKGRFLYNHAGLFLEEATKLCFALAFPESKSVRIPNTQGDKPKMFEIDCLVGDTAHEIKWRDATTDGDHINKERTRIQVISEAGLLPIRLMFFYPNRDQAMKIQAKVAELYLEEGGECYFGPAAWEYVKRQTGVDLFQILEEIARSSE